MNSTIKNMKYVNTCFITGICIVSYMMRCSLWRVELGLELNCAFAHGKSYIMIRYCLGKNSLSKALFIAYPPHLWYCQSRDFSQILIGEIAYDNKKQEIFFR